MTAAIALAIVLVIAVAGMSLAMQSQHPMQQQPTSPRTPRPARPPRVPRPSGVPRRPKDRRSTPQPDAPANAPAEPAEPEIRIPDLLRDGVEVQAKVLSVVDERTLGPVTRSKLTLRIEPAEGAAFEVTLRTAFASPAARARVKVGGTVPVRYDKDDHRRVVLALPIE